MTASEALEWLRQPDGSDRRASQVLWLTGPDRLARERLVAAVAARLGDDALRLTLDGGGDPAETLLWLNTEGFWQENRWVLWREPDARSLKRAGWAELAAATGPTRWLVVSTEKAAPPAGMAATRVTLEEPRGAAWTALVERELSRRGLKLPRTAQLYLSEACRPEGVYLERALEKLELARASGMTLQEETVRDLVAPLGDSAFYPLTDALVRRETVRAYRMATAHLALGVAPALLLVVMSRQMLLVDAWTRERAAGTPVETFLASRGLRPWQARLYRDAGQAWRVGEPARWLSYAGQVDGALKHSAGDPAAWIGALVLASAG